MPRPAKPGPVRCQLNQTLSHPLGAAIFSRQAWEEIARSLKLSGRHFQVVQGMFNDYTEAAIAGDLKVSPHTVHTYSERLYRKLGVTGRVRLALRVMDEYIALTLSGTLPPLCAKCSNVTTISRQSANQLCAAAEELLVGKVSPQQPACAK